MALPARLKRLLKSSPATAELADYLEGEGVETTPDEPVDDTPTDDTPADDTPAADGNG